MTLSVKLGSKRGILDTFFLFFFYCVSLMGMCNVYEGCMGYKGGELRGGN